MKTALDGCHDSAGDAQKDENAPEFAVRAMPHRGGLSRSRAVEQATACGESVYGARWWKVEKSNSKLALNAQCKAPRSQLGRP